MCKKKIKHTKSLIEERRNNIKRFIVKRGKKGLQNRLLTKEEIIQNDLLREDEILEYGLLKKKMKKIQFVINEERKKKYKIAY